MKTLSLFAFIFVALFVAQNINAATSVTPNVSGYSSGFYKPYVNPAYVPGTLSGTATVSINTSQIQVSAKLAPAANAGSYAKASLFSNPWLQGVLLLAWAGDAGLNSDVVGGGWEYLDPLATDTYYERIMPVDSSVAGCRSANGGLSWGYCDGSMQECAINYAPLIEGRTCVAINSVGQNLGGYATYNEPYPDSAMNLQIAPYGSCVDGASSISGSANCKIAAEPRPATEEDFLALPEPEIGVLAELAPQVGVPVEQPTYDFAPFQTPLGQPYTKPDGSTVQPMAQISPNGNQVTVDTFDMPLTNPDGSPVINPVPQDTTESTESAPSPTQCDKFPATLGCATLDIPTAENLLTEARNVALISPVSIGGAGSCPAPLTASFLGQTVEMSFDPLCQFANSLRPLVLVLAWLSAGVIFIGGVRNG